MDDSLARQVVRAVVAIGGSVTLFLLVAAGATWLIARSGAAPTSVEVVSPSPAPSAPSKPTPLPSQI